MQLHFFVLEKKNLLSFAAKIRKYLNIFRINIYLKFCKQFLVENEETAYCKI